MGGKNFNSFPVLITERLVLRQLIIDDADEIFALRSNDNVNKYLNRKSCESVDDAKNFIQMINEIIRQNNSIYWAITLNNSAQFIGTICLYGFSDQDLKAEIGYELLPEFQGKGLMQEAVAKVIDFGIHQIGLNLIEAYTHIQNKNSTRLLERLNFRKEGTNEDTLITFRYTVEKQPH